MVQLYFLYEKVAKKMSNSTNSEVVFDDEFPQYDILNIKKED